jgi:hypothetical protein
MKRAERRAAPKPARTPAGGRPMYSSDRGAPMTRFERRAAGNEGRPLYSADGAPQ